MTPSLHSRQHPPPLRIPLTPRLHPLKRIPIRSRPPPRLLNAHIIPHNTVIRPLMDRRADAPEVRDLGLLLSGQGGGGAGVVGLDHVFHQPM